LGKNNGTEKKFEIPSRGPMRGGRGKGGKEERELKMGVSGSEGKKCPFLQKAASTAQQKKKKKGNSHHQLMSPFSALFLLSKKRRGGKGSKKAAFHEQRGEGEKKKKVADLHDRGGKRGR